MTRRILIIAAAVAALASPLIAADQTVEKATRFRVTAEEAVVPQPPAPEGVSLEEVDVTKDTASELELSVQVEELGPFSWNDNSEQVEELGEGRFNWNQSADQVEELGPGMLNQADQVEELGDGGFIWAQSTDQVEDLGPRRKKKVAVVY
jgi:hypothetical protein